LQELDLNDTLDLKLGGGEIKEMCMRNG